MRREKINNKKISFSVFVRYQNKIAMTLTPGAREGGEENRRGEDDHFVQASHVERCD
jgi:hypothetical protein